MYLSILPPWRAMIAPSPSKKALSMAARASGGRSTLSRPKSVRSRKSTDTGRICIPFLFSRARAPEQLSDPALLEGTVWTLSQMLHSHPPELAVSAGAAVDPDASRLQVVGELD